MDDSASRFQTSFHVIYDEIMPAISHYHTHASLGNRFSPPPRPFRGHFPADITAELSAPPSLSLPPPSAAFSLVWPNDVDDDFFSIFCYKAPRQFVEERSLTRAVSTVTLTSLCNHCVETTKKDVRPLLDRDSASCFLSSYFEPWRR